MNAPMTVVAVPKPKSVLLEDAKPVPIQAVTGVNAKPVSVSKMITAVHSPGMKPA